MAERGWVPFHLMAKPAGARCNLACSYCYYLDKAALYPVRPPARMSAAVLERYVQQLLAAHPVGSEVVFSWQGGEPALLGLDFYRQAVTLQRQFGGQHRILNTFQTNGTLLDDDWCRFFAAENFLVGLSLDGPAELHDRYRRHASGRPTHAAVLRALEGLQAHGVEFNLLACVTAHNSAEPLAVYRFLRQVGGRFLQFLPVVEPLPDGSGVTPESVPAAAYGEFMATVFDEWARHDIGRVTVLNFDWALANLLGRPGAVCHHQPVCGRSLAVEHNGDVYACDHFVAPAYRLGNLAGQELPDLLDSAPLQAFGRAKLERLPPACRQCEVLGLCWGGCPKHRGLNAASPENYLCAGYAHFFRHALPALHRMAGEIAARRT